jgi:Tfp pilus assembly protein FimT
MLADILIILAIFALVALIVAPIYREFQRNKYY